MEKILPIRRLILTDEKDSEGNYKYGIKWIALVDKPAIDEFWIAFNKHEKEMPIKFEAINEEKRIVMGPYIVANRPIYRIDEKTKEEFLVVMDAETIEAVLIRFAQQGNQSNINIMHDSKKPVTGITMYQNWIINSDLGINAPKNWPDLSDGSAMGVWKIDNDVAWAKVKDGTYAGPSIEGLLKLEPINELTEEEAQAIIDAV